MKILDLYIIRKFFGTFFYILVIFIAISIIFDISEKAEDFVSKNIPMRKVVVDYYLNFIPYLINLFSALFVFITVIFFTSQMASRTEIVAILTSGVSFKRMLLPYFLVAGVLAGASFYLNSYVLPKSNKVRLDFEKQYIGYTAHSWTRNIHQQILPGTFIYMESFNLGDSVGYKFAMEKFEGPKLKSKLMSDRISFNRQNNKWKIENYMLREFNGLKEKVSTGAVLDTALNFKPSDFGDKNTDVQTMTNPEIKDYIAEQQLRGVGNISSYYVELYKRSALPFATFILTFIGVCIASRKVRGGIGLHLGLGILLCFTYILFMQISYTFSINGDLNPLLAVWLPNIFYAGIGLYIYRIAPK